MSQGSQGSQGLEITGAETSSQRLDAARAAAEREGRVVIVDDPDPEAVQREAKPFSWFWREDADRAAPAREGLAY